MTEAELEALRSQMRESSLDIQRHVEALIAQSVLRHRALLDVIRADIAAYRQREAALQPDVFERRPESAVGFDEAVAETPAATEGPCSRVVEVAR